MADRQFVIVKALRRFLRRLRWQLGGWHGCDGRGGAWVEVNDAQSN